MATTKRSTLKMLFFLKKKKLLKNGEAPICLRITVDRQDTDIRIKRSIPVSQWNQKKGCSNAKGNSANELNLYLETVKTRILQIHRQLEIDGKEINPFIISDIYFGRDVESKKLLDIYKEHNLKCKALIGKGYKESTVKKFDTSLKSLKEYIQYQYKQEDIKLSMIDKEFITSFEFYLKANKNLQQNSANKHLKNLKKIILIALSHDWIKKDPFIGTKIKDKEVIIDFLSHEELQRMINKQFTIKRLELVRDIFIFCCYTGLAFTDVKHLKKEHLITDNSGNLWIRKSREKTMNMCNIPVINAAKNIANKYANHPDCIAKSVILPVMSNQKMNASLKEIADLCGITKNLTTHVARHTCATVVMLANNVSIENVAKILGHSNTKMTHHYAKVLDSSILRDIGNVEASFK